MLSCKVRPVFTAVLLLASMLLLSACRNLPDPGLATEPESWNSHLATVTALERWSLNGRLNIRQDNNSDTVNLSWRQDTGDFDISMSGALGLGAVRVSGSSNRVMVEKAGENPVFLPGLGALSQEFLGYEFPADYLLYWVRGLPVPELSISATWNEQGQLATLEQQDSVDQSWSLEFDRYDTALPSPLPGRIRLQHGSLRLTFLISDWNLGNSSP